MKVKLKAKNWFELVILHTFINLNLALFMKKYCFQEPWFSICCIFSKCAETELEPKTTLGTSKVKPNIDVNMWRSHCCMILKLYRFYKSLRWAPLIGKPMLGSPLTYFWLDDAWSCSI